MECVVVSAAENSSVVAAEWLREPFVVMVSEKMESLAAVIVALGSVAEHLRTAAMGREMLVAVTLVVPAEQVLLVAEAGSVAAEAGSVAAEAGSVAAEAGSVAAEAGSVAAEVVVPEEHTGSVAAEPPHERPRPIEEYSAAVRTLVWKEWIPVVAADVAMAAAEVVVVETQDSKVSFVAVVDDAAQTSGTWIGSSTEELKVPHSPPAVEASVARTVPVALNEVASVAAEHPCSPHHLPAGAVAIAHPVVK